MYWSVWARRPDPTGSIETANMDGSERRILLEADLEWPNGFVLDLDKQVLYWCDTKLNKIESLELGTNKRSTILAAPEPNIQEPYGLILDKRDIIWREKSTGLIRRPSGSNITTAERVTPPLYDIRMVVKNPRGGTNVCSSDNGGCMCICAWRPPWVERVPAPRAAKPTPITLLAALKNPRTDIVQEIYLKDFLTRV